MVRLKAATSVLLALLALASAGVVRADVVTDWNETACAITAKAGGGAVGHRLMGYVQVAVFEAVNSIERRYKPYTRYVEAEPGASVDAAVAAANRGVMVALLAAEKPAIEAAYQAALAKIADGKAKTDGIAVGERAAAMLLARAAADGSATPETYKWHTTPGVYVPTMVPVASTWMKRAPWILDRADQFRPGPPPDLSSETWKRDLQEVKILGAKEGSQRTAEQTAIARFWEETRPLLYHGVLRSAATAVPGRSVAQNARLLAAGAMAIDDALIAVFDAKYTYNLWRPMTAIRHGAERGVAFENGWTPFVNTPMHPEYPCAHCVSSGSIGAVLIAEFGAEMPKLRTKSPTADNAVREWGSVADFMDEVRMARIYDGVHYRFSTEVGNDLGRKVGALVQERLGR